MPTDYRYAAKVEVLQFDSIKIMETGTSGTRVVISTHGMTNTDFYGNITRATNPPDRYGGATYRRKIQNASTNTFYSTVSVAGQTTGDVAILYKFTDVTDMLLDGTLKLQLQTQGDDSASFSLVHDYEPHGDFTYAKGFFYTSASTTSIYLTAQTKTYNLPRKSWLDRSSTSAFLRRQSFEGKSGVGYSMQGEGVFPPAHTASYGYCDLTEQFTVATNVWVDKTSASFPRTACHAAYVGDNIYVHGGVMPGPIYYSDCERYSISGDSWASMTPGHDESSGDGINLCDCLFVAYTKDSVDMTAQSKFYVVNNNSWVTYWIDNALPARCFARSGFTIDGFKGNVLGGTVDYAGLASYAIDSNTMINFPCKVYTERNVIPADLKEVYAAQYGGYAIIAGGNGTYEDYDYRSYSSNSYYWNPLADTWTSLGTFDVNGKCGGQGAAL